MADPRLRVEAPEHACGQWQCRHNIRGAISDAQHYAYRPSELAPLNAIEFVLRFKVEKAVTPADACPTTGLIVC